MEKQDLPISTPKPERKARLFDLWALGVGAVVSGNFFGWNFGLALGGLGGMIIALVLAALLYLCLCESIAELSSMSSSEVGGAFVFAREGFREIGWGKWAAFVAGLGQNMEYVLAPAAISVGIGSLVLEISTLPQELAPVVWTLTYLFFIILNIRGINASLVFSDVLCIISILILTVFYVASVTYAFPGGSSKSELKSFDLKNGALGVLGSIPFAMWLFLAVEELPLASGEAINPKKDIPRSIHYALATLVALGTLTVILFANVVEEKTLGETEKPLHEGFSTIFGSGLITSILSSIALAGLLASFHSILFAFGRQILELSRGGYFPAFLGKISKKGTPYTAILFGSFIGWALLISIHFLAPHAADSVGAVVLTISVLGALISYILQLLSMIILRVKRKDLDREYRSKLGIPGAILGVFLSLTTIVFMFIVDPVYRIAALGALGWYGLALIYFLVQGRKNVVNDATPLKVIPINS
eukprot:TRINITY_DN675_c0_g1_i1.p1 TRINITY_DN675_c0_g1~~TRINITY_DN675_c0_g1_i1.p1  ORF type:complete len:475 (+),score=112.22 TRINITY_DN675_c0_g1_i1:161-1585(+)